jgi:hypothetical protein
MVYFGHTLLVVSSPFFGNGFSATKASNDSPGFITVVYTINNGDHKGLGGKHKVSGDTTIGGFAQGIEGDFDVEVSQVYNTEGGALLHDTTLLKSLGNNISLLVEVEEEEDEDTK